MADEVDHMSQGHELLRSGKYEEALASFEQVTGSPSELYHAGLGKVAAYRGLGELEKAWHRWVYTSSLASPCNVPGAAWVYHTMARFHLDRGASAATAWKGDDWEAVKHAATALILSGDRPATRWRTAKEACIVVGLDRTADFMGVVPARTHQDPNRCFCDGTGPALEEIESKLAANPGGQAAESLRFLKALVLFVGRQWVESANALRKIADGNEEAKAIVESLWMCAMAEGDDLWNEGHRIEAQKHWEASRELNTRYAILVRLSFAQCFQGNIEAANELAALAVQDIVERTGFWNWIAMCCWELSLEEWAEYRPVLQGFVGNPYVDHCDESLPQALDRVEEYIGYRRAVLRE